MADEKLWSVYIHHCPNGKKYIGITSRLCQDRWLKGLGYKKNKHFYSAIVKYGWDNIIHEIVADQCLTKEEAQAKEKELIAIYMSNHPDFGYNHSAGGEGKAGFVPTEETRIKIRKKLLGTHRPDEVKRKCSVSHSGKSLSEEHKLKIRTSCKNINSKKVICLTTGIIYASAAEAARKTGVSRSGITACCRGERASCRKLMWKYLEGGDCDVKWG